MPAGETEKSPSGWTVDTLAAHVQQQINDMRTLLDERYATQTKAVDAAFASAEKAVDKALLSAEKAVEKAEKAANERFESVNEFRAQLADQAATFMPRVESIQRHEQSTEKINALEARHASDVAIINSRLDTAAGRTSGLDKGWALLAGAIAAAGAVIAIILNLNP